MAIATPVYCTREDVASALEVSPSVRAHAQIDRLIEASAREIDRCLHRTFWPQLGTRYKPWPDPQSPTPWRLWLDADELISVTALSSGGILISSDEYLLEPINTGPPYNRIELNLAGSATFGGGSTHQRDVTIVGLWGGCPATETPAGALAEALDDSETVVDVTDGAAIGVGDLLRVDSERMLVTGRSWLDSTDNLQSPLTASASNTTVTVNNGAGFTADEPLLLDSERMLIVDIASNTLTVKRAQGGSVLTTHTGSDVYVSRSLTVVRGAAGTTAASHSNGAALVKHVPPQLIRQLNIAEVINALQQESSAYARVAGAGDNQREMTGRGLDDLRERAYTAHGRKARSRAV